MKNTLFTKLLAAGVASLFGCVLLTACSGVEFAVSVPCDHKAVLLERVEATCTANGKTAGSMCELCGQILDAPELIPAPGHNFKEVSCTEPLTCALCGATEGQAVGHAFEEATCKKPMTCRKCGATEGEVLAHDYKDGVCAVCGERKESEGLSYSFNAGGESYAVTGLGSCKDSILVIPETYEGKPVTVITSLAATDITEVYLPKSILRIETRAFEQCGKLTRVSIHEGLTYVGSFAFEGCTALEEIRLPDTTQAVGGFAFNGCTSLKTAYLPDGVTVLGMSVFADCSSLVTVQLPTDVPSLDKYTLYHCKSLETVKFNGTKAEWNALPKESSWDLSSSAFVVVCSDGEINK